MKSVVELSFVVLHSSLTIKKMHWHRNNSKSGNKKHYKRNLLIWWRVIIIEPPHIERKKRNSLCKICHQMFNQQKTNTMFKLTESKWKWSYGIKTNIRKHMIRQIDYISQQYHVCKDFSTFSITKHKNYATLTS